MKDIFNFQNEAINIWYVHVVFIMFKIKKKSVDFKNFLLLLLLVSNSFLRFLLLLAIFHTMACLLLSCSFFTLGCDALLNFSSVCLCIWLDARDIFQLMRIIWPLHGITNIFFFKIQFFFYRFKLLFIEYMFRLVSVVSLLSSTCCLRSVAICFHLLSNENIRLLWVYWSFHSTDSMNYVFWTVLRGKKFDNMNWKKKTITSAAKTFSLFRSLFRRLTNSQLYTHCAQRRKKKNMEWIPIPTQMNFKHYDACLTWKSEWGNLFAAKGERKKSMHFSANAFDEFNFGIRILISKLHNLQFEWKKRR